MISKILNKLFNIETVYAHCDIPCGVYHPYPMQESAFTAKRMLDLIAELDKNAADYDHKFSRYVATKEEHAEKCKHDVRVIWGDYFKPAVHGDNFNKANELSHKIMLLGSQVRQGLDVRLADQLIDAVNEFATVFWATKNIETTRMKAPFPVAGELVTPKA